MQPETDNQWFVQLVITKDGVEVLDVDTSSGIEVITAYGREIQQVGTVRRLPSALPCRACTSRHSRPPCLAGAPWPHWPPAAHPRARLLHPQYKFDRGMSVSLKFEDRANGRAELIVDADMVDVKMRIFARAATKKRHLTIELGSNSKRPQNDKNSIPTDPQIR